MAHRCIIITLCDIYVMSMLYLCYVKNLKKPYRIQYNKTNKGGLLYICNVFTMYLLYVCKGVYTE